MKRIHVKHMHMKHIRTTYAYEAYSYNTCIPETTIYIYNVKTNVP